MQQPEYKGSEFRYARQGLYREKKNNRDAFKQKYLSDDFSKKGDYYISMPKLINIQQSKTKEAS